MYKMWGKKIWKSIKIIPVLVSWYSDSRKKYSIESVISFIYVLAFFTYFSILLHFIYMYKHLCIYELYIMQKWLEI